MNRPQFISFEGIDGAGKSTHLAATEARLRATGATVVRTREPGGTVLAETLRELVLHQRMDALSEALLVFAARREHWLDVVQPALQRSEVVLCDRFADASFAYQGGGRGVAWEQLQVLERWTVGGRTPDLTLWFTLDPAEAARRRAAAREADRFEAQELDFFHRVHAAYERRRQESPDRFECIDAAPSVQAVGEQLAAALQRRGW
ncbi:dTMP kinase [Inhella gelatinilytica]|uniref:Thymidylate kinase n=1 Tax=Inhella gelatinilytica TaxID=2795030 RepID=A0A931IUK4_9BURK|nr:dTMP kinase [Inhella gelatinilytica]MBH9553045.1 dTMP kinase [Inhella gelatinilytica]